MIPRQYIALYTGLVSLSIGLSLQAPSCAQSPLDMVRDYFAPNQLNSTRARFDSSQMQTMTNLNSRRDQLNALLSNSLGIGQISPQLANDFRAQLNQNRFLQDQYTSDGQFSFAEAQTVLTALNDLDSRMQATISSNSTFAPSPIGNIWAPAEFDRIRAQVSSRLDQGRANGRLTASEYNSLRNQLDQIIAQRRQPAYSGRFSNRGEYRRLMSRLTALDNRVTREINDNQFASRGRRYWH